MLSEWALICFGKLFTALLYSLFDICSTLSFCTLLIMLPTATFTHVPPTCITSPIRSPPFILTLSPALSSLFTTAAAAWPAATLSSFLPEPLPSLSSLRFLRSRSFFILASILRSFSLKFSCIRVLLNSSSSLRTALVFSFSA